MTDKPRWRIHSTDHHDLCTTIESDDITVSIGVWRKQACDSMAAADEVLEHLNGYDRLTHCNYCGYLRWTIEEYGVLVHKEMCPNRLAHQGNATFLFPPK